jgi:uncharacterized small protein (DUF1192 family)
MAFRGGDAMPVLDEELPKKKKAHEIGEDLAALSLDELDARIESLRNEIRRIEDAIKSKRASATAADAFFKR